MILGMKSKLLIGAILVCLTVPVKAVAVTKAGDSCKQEGKIQKVGTSTFECRVVSKGRQVLVKVTNNRPAIANVQSPNGLNTCQLTDQRTKVSAPHSIAFPNKYAYEGFKPAGVHEIAVIPIDFPNSPGKGKPSEIYAQELKKIDEWLSWYTNGKMQYKWQVKDEWIRAPKESSQYTWIHPGNSGTQGRDSWIFIQELIDISLKSYDLKNISGVFFIYPRDVKDIEDAYTAVQGLNIPGNVGRGYAVTATGQWLYRNKYPIWAWFIHELLHPHGIAGHAPAYPEQFGIAHNQSGMGLNINAWDSIILDWANPEDIFCIDQKELSKVSLTLVPIEREQRGVRSAVIKVSDSQALVVESHRKDKWGSTFKDGFYGVMTYLVDTTVDTDRTGEFQGKDDGKGVEWTRNANYLKLSGVNHGQYAMQKVVKGIGVQGPPYWDLNYVMYQGESLTYKDVKISLTKTGDNDTIQIERVK